ncbi:MAG: hypothetical protein AB8B80_07405 [Marinicellaceae bacterium]
MKYIWMSGLLAVIWGVLLLIFMLLEKYNQSILVATFFMSIVLTLIIPKLSGINKSKDWTQASVKISCMLILIGHAIIAYMVYVFMTADSGTGSALWIITLTLIILALFFYLFGTILAYSKAKIEPKNNHRDNNK